MTAVNSSADNLAFLPLGALIQEFRVAGHNFCLSLPNQSAYVSTGNPGYFGETIGRVANRISGAKINSLNGKSYSLKANNGPNTLHGGPKGWGKQMWEGPKPVNRNGREGVEFRYVSKDGDEGFPGTVECKCWYLGYKEKDAEDGVEKTNLEVEYEVQLIGDEVEETVVSVTNHSSFTVSDGVDITGTEAKLYTVHHQETDSADLPTGKISAFPGLTAGKAFTLNATEPAIDHCFIVSPSTSPSSIPLDTRSQPLAKLCSLYHPNTRMHFEALSTEPAFQFYTGEYINVPAVDGEPAKGKRAGICVEASRYINCVNNDEWRGMVLLKKGQTWGSKTIYRGWKA